jgi:hypothetical protein
MGYGVECEYILISINLIAALKKGNLWGFARNGEDERRDN